MKKINATNKHRVRQILCVTAAALGLNLTHPVWADVSFTTFDHGGDDWFSAVTAVSADGSVVTGTRSDYQGYSYEAFRWSVETGATGLGHITHDFWGLGQGTDISADGSVIVGYDSVNSNEAYRWTAAGGMVGLGDLADGIDYSFASAVSADGSIVIGTSVIGYNQNNSFILKPFRWTVSTGMQLVAGLDGASAISADGKVLAGMKYTAYPTEFVAHRLTPTGVEALGELPGGGVLSNSTAVSTDGTVVVGYSSSNLGDEAFYWSQTTGMVGLGDLPGGAYQSYARSVSGNGKLVVGAASTSAGAEPFIWSALTGMLSLKDLMIAEGVDMTNWKLLTASDISQDGSTIVGDVTDASGKQLGYVLHLIDFDHDGYNQPADCDDFAPTVYPAAPEIKFDAIDQNCNGYDLTIGVKQSVYFSSTQNLVLRATSGLGRDAKLTVTGFGPMRWDETRQSWNLHIKNVTSAPASVIISGIEGKTTATVSVR